MMSKNDRKDLPTLEELRKMKYQDIKEIDKNDLVDIADVDIDPQLPVEERVIQFLKQIKNPYCYISNGFVVRASFAEERTIEDALLHYAEIIEG